MFARIAPTHAVKRPYLITLFASALLMTSCAQNTTNKVVPVVVPEFVPEISENRAGDNETALTESQALAKEVDQALEAAADNQSDNQSGNQADDQIAAIIWELEKADNQTSAQDADDEIVSFESLIPEGRDPSLEAEALDAAFAMLRAPKLGGVPAGLPGDELARQVPFSPPAKQARQKRIGVFVPLNGPREIYGSQVADGIEMAYFQLNDAALEIIYFDTSDEAMIGALATEAIDAEIDLAIGPLFSANASAAFPYFSEASIPVLSLSNNVAIARPGLWVLGLLPEQQIDALLAESILKGHDNIAILSDYSDYGRALSAHLVGRLAAFGIAPATVSVVDGTVGADDENLVQALKAFTHYKPLEDDQLIQDVPPPYDSVVLAGGSDFVLKVAPLLSYYDLGPDRVSYLGTDLWASAGLLGEPSLQGAYVATINPELRQAFGVRYDGLFNGAETNQNQSASFLSQLGFDAMAVAATAARAIGQEALDDNTTSDNATSDNGARNNEARNNEARNNQAGALQSPLIRRLVSEAGFKGYTGAFRLTADGRNNRTYSLFQVEDGTLVPAVMEAKEF